MENGGETKNLKGLESKSLTQNIWYVILAKLCVIGLIILAT